MEKKITKREVLAGIANGVQTGDYNGITVEDIVAFCENEIALLDKKAIKAKERAAEKRAAGDELKAAVKDALTDEFVTRDVVAAKVAETFGEDASIAKVGYRLTVLVNEGVAESTDLKIAGGEGAKTRTVKGYKLV